MRDFARPWPDQAMLPQAVAKIPWGHIRCLLDKLNDQEARLWYAERTVEQGWSRKLLEHHIASGRYEREGRALTNFSNALPAAEREMSNRSFMRTTTSTCGPSGRSLMSSG